MRPFLRRAQAPGEGERSETKPNSQRPPDPTPVSHAWTDWLALAVYRRGAGRSERRKRNSKVLVSRAGFERDPEKRHAHEDGDGGNQGGLAELGDKARGTLQ